MSTASVTKQAKIAVSSTIADQFRAWLIQKGFAAGSKPSTTQWARSIQEQRWTRRRGARMPAVDPRDTKDSEHLHMNLDEYRYLFKGVAEHYKSWGHFLVDFMDNWERV